MIQRVQIKGFRCLADVELELAPLTVLIGPNDSGKSSVLDALELLSKSGATPLDRLFKLDRRLELIAWDAASPVVAWHVEGTDSAKWMYDLTLESDPGPRVRSERLRTEAEAPVPPPLPGGTRTLIERAHKSGPSSIRQIARLWTTHRYAFDESTLAQQVKRLTLGRDGTERKQRINEQLCERIASVRQFYVEEKRSAVKLWFELATGQTVPASGVSYGVRALLGYLTFVETHARHGLVLIEEPENGFHPERLRDVLDLLRSVAANGGPQVLLTTHSPLVVNEVAPEEVFLCTRGDRGVGPTTIRRLDKIPKVRDLLDSFSLGEVWYNVGEEHLVSGD